MKVKDPAAHDLVLRILRNGIAVGDLTFKRKREFEEKDVDAILETLVHMGFIQVYTIANSDGTAYTITQEGTVFINNTSFEEQQGEDQERQLYQKTLDAKNTNTNTRMMWIAAGSLAISIFALIDSRVQTWETNDQVNKVNKRIDSLISGNLKSSREAIQTKANESEPVKQIKEESSIIRRTEQK